MSRYYLEGIPKSSVILVLLGVHLYTIHRVQRTIYQHMSGGPLVYVRQKVVYILAKDKSVHPPNLAYIHTKRQVPSVRPY
jgi:hypothetical protein